MVIWSGSVANFLLAYSVLALVSTSGTDAHLSSGCLCSVLVLSQRGISLKLLSLSLSLLGRGVLLELLGLGMVTRSLLLAEIDVGRWLRDVALATLDKAALQGDDVVTKAVVLALQSLIILGQVGIVAHLGLEGFDMAFFALAEGTLLDDQLVSWPRAGRAEGKCFPFYLGEGVDKV